MTAPFMVYFIALPFAAITMLGRGHSLELSDVEATSSNINPGSLRRIDDRTFPELSRNVREAKDQRVLKREDDAKIIFNEVCGPALTEVEPTDNTLQARMLGPLVDMLRSLRKSSLGDGTGGTQLPPYLKQILESNLTEGGHASICDIMRDRFVNSTRSGLFNGVEKWDYSRAGYLGAFHRLRRVLAHVTTSVADYYYNQVEGPSGLLPCPLIAGYPFLWLIASDNERFEWIDIMALPAIEREDGSFRIVNPPLNLTTLSTVNELFLKENNWTTTNIAGLLTPFETVASNSTWVAIKMPLDVYNCTVDYLIRCRQYSMTPRDKLCTLWSNRCGIQTAIKLPDSNKNGTHMLYMISKTYGGNSTVRNGVASRPKPLTHSRRKAWTSSQGKLSEIMYSTQQTESFYLPKREPDQDLLTLAVIFLVFFSEWILSASFVLGKLYKKIRWEFCGRASDEWERKSRQSYGGTKKKFKQSCVLLTPVLLEFIPLALGLHQAAKRKDAVVGTLASGWASQSYRAFQDSHLEAFDADKGASLSLVVEYREFSKFDNLFCHYLIATCVAAALLVFLLCALLFQGRALSKEPQKNVVEEFQEDHLREPLASRDRSQFQTSTEVRT